MSRITKKQRYENDIENLERFNNLFVGYHDKYVANKICYYCINKILAKCDYWIKNGAKSGNFGDLDYEYRHLENLVTLSRSGKSIVYLG